MAPLRNQRWERFAVGLFEGLSADEAFVKAGYSKNRGNASRLKANEIVSARLTELQSEAASNSKVTVESICRELDEANAVAKAKGQAAAMVSAATLRAKLAGLMVERVEVGNPSDFDNCEGFTDIADKMIEDMITGFYPVDEQDRQGLIKLIESQAAALGEYIDAIKARPIVAERVDPRKLDTPWQSLPRHPSARLPTRNGNGAGE
jgi:peptide subunit release factor 1 (eRF1)